MDCEHTHTCYLVGKFMTGNSPHRSINRRDFRSINVLVSNPEMQITEHYTKESLPSLLSRSFEANEVSEGCFYTSELEHARGSIRLRLKRVFLVLFLGIGFD